jgi:hypothetical protein
MMTQENFADSGFRDSLQARGNMRSLINGKQDVFGIAAKRAFRGSNEV